MHWRSAEAVRDGRQPAVDPDIEALEELRDGLRLYTARPGSDGARRLCKRLVDGMWQLEVIEVPAGEQLYSGRGMAGVA